MGLRMGRRVLKGNGIDRTEVNLPQSNMELVNYRSSGPKEGKGALSYLSELSSGQDLGTDFPLFCNMLSDKLVSK
ncbi:hypothetical protein L195_g024880, partial [Trifolium pratense]